MTADKNALSDEALILEAEEILITELLCVLIFALPLILALIFMVLVVSAKIPQALLFTSILIFPATLRIEPDLAAIADAEFLPSLREIESLISKFFTVLFCKWEPVLITSLTIPCSPL